MKQAAICVGVFIIAAVFVYVSYHPLVPAPFPKLVAPIGGEHAEVLFGGDMMFDRTIRTTVEAKGGDYLFSCLDPLLDRNDLVVANLEGPITPNYSRSVGSIVGSPDNYVFTFPLSTAALLAKHHIEMVNLGNNHITNFGNTGIASTKSALTAAGVGYFGDPVDSTVATTTINGIKIAFINYNEYIQPEKGGTSASVAISQIKAARIQGYFPVVFTHWGIEYQTTAPAYVQALGHQFIDAGAEIIIGTSPHVVEQSEIYKGKYIYYSLGNMIFDQYFDTVVDHGLMVQVTFGPQGVVSTKDFPIVLNEDRQTCPVNSL